VMARAFCEASSKTKPQHAHLQHHQHPVLDSITAHWNRKASYQQCTDSLTLLIVVVAVAEVGVSD
jgi:hypothetical protein